MPNVPGTLISGLMRNGFICILARALVFDLILRCFISNVASANPTSGCEQTKDVVTAMGTPAVKCLHQ